MHFVKTFGRVASCMVLSAAILPCSVFSCADASRTSSVNSQAGIANGNTQKSTTSNVSEPKQTTKVQTSLVTTECRTRTTTCTTTRSTTQPLTTTVITLTSAPETTTLTQEQLATDDSVNLDTSTALHEDSDISAEPVEFNFDEIWNGIIINNQVIETVICPSYQENIDAYDVVQDVDYLSKENDIVLIGHNYRSFAIIETIAVGDTVILVNYGVPYYYEVHRSELSYLNYDRTDIFSCEQGDSLFQGDFGFENTLRLITCSSDNRPGYQWIVVAERIE